MVVSNMQSYIICSLCQIKLHDSATLTVYYKAGNINWLELNVVVDPKIAIVRVLADLNLAVLYGIAICVCASRKFWLL